MLTGSSAQYLLLQSKTLLTWVGGGWEEVLWFRLKTPFLSMELWRQGCVPCWGPWRSGALGNTTSIGDVTISLSLSSMSQPERLQC